MHPTCPEILAVNVVNGDVGTLLHDAWTDHRLVQLGGDIASKSYGEERVENASHGEVNCDQAKNDEEVGVKH